MVSYEGALAFEVLSVTEQEAVGVMPIAEGMLNPFGTVHAGAMVWFADVVATHLALQGVEMSEGMKGFPLAINFAACVMSNRREGELRAVARFVKRGRRVTTVRTTVEAEGKVLLELTSTHVPA